MTPREKAKQLIENYNLVVLDTALGGSNARVKKCALIAVDEIIRLDIFNCNCEWSDEDGDTREYWQEVKQEIENI